MPDKLLVIEKEKLVKIVSSGEVTDSDIAKSIDTITKLFDQGKISKVIVDTRNQEMLPEAGSLYFLSEKLPAGLKIALVITKNQKTKMALKFFETTSYNKGKSMKIFESLGEAKIWLD